MPRRCSAGIRTLGAVAAAATAVVIAAAPANAAPTPGGSSTPTGAKTTGAATPTGQKSAGVPTPAAPLPVMSIEVNDNAGSVGPGRRVTYTVRVHNGEPTDLTGYQLTANLPPEVRIGSAHPAAAADGHSWNLNIPAGKETSVSFDATVGNPAATVHRLAITACVSQPSGPPIVCGTDSDTIDRATAGVLSGGAAWGLTLGGIALVGGIGGAAFLLMRRRGTTPGSGTTA